jgi:hypothetical protein
MKTPQSTGSFALCVENGGVEDLEARKVYQVRSRPTTAQRRAMKTRSGR